MARHETDREDLLVEATALRERVELAVPGEAEPVVAGFRDNGWFSVYFGADPVYHFDKEGRLRRAFVGGNLYRSQARTLARLTRTRTDSATTLIRHDLDAAELDDFLSAMQYRLDRLIAALEQHAVQVVRQVPAEEDLLSRLRRALLDAGEGRLSPEIKKKRGRNP